MNGQNPVTCELLPWDTEFFGCRIARVTGDTLRPEPAKEIDDWSHQHQIRALYFLARADDAETARTAVQHGFDLVDIRITYECSLTDSVPPARTAKISDAALRPCQSADLPALQALARAGHHDTRFFSDRHFLQSRAEELYATWIALEVQGRAQKVLVAATKTDQPVGYISCHYDPARRTGQIGLTGVDPAVRGRGIGNRLVLAAMDWCRSQGAQQMTVVTQGKNLAAQRLYQRCGFLTQNLQLWYHKWYPLTD